MTKPKVFSYMIVEVPSDPHSRTGATTTCQRCVRQVTVESIFMRQAVASTTLGVTTSPRSGRRARLDGLELPPESGMPQVDYFPGASSRGIARKDVIPSRTSQLASSASVQSGSSIVSSSVTCRPGEVEAPILLTTSSLTGWQS